MLCKDIDAACSALCDDLHEQWLELRNDARGLQASLACVEMLHRSGVFGDESRKLWVRRLQSCPGHSDEGGRSWCAYCGNVSASPAEPDAAHCSAASARTGDPPEADGTAER